MRTVFILINSKMLHEVSSLKEKRKALASLELVPGSTGNIRARAFARRKLWSSKGKRKSSTGKTVPIKVVAEKGLITEEWKEYLGVSLSGKNRGRVIPTKAAV
jgi:hypothetical protein